MKIGFIGCGNMGSALARAISKVSETNIYIYDYDQDKSAILSKEICAQVCNNSKIASDCDFIFLGVKPNVLPSVIEAIKPSLAMNTSGILVSMAAGVTLEKISGILGSYPTIRIMPNTPVAVAVGMISFCHNAAVTDDAIENFKTIMSEAGALMPIDEKLIDAATAVAGCGPAFVYMFAEALADGGVECGLPRNVSIQMAAQTIKGAAEMLLKTGKHPGQLKDDVCSPGGSTISGVHALENGSFRADAIGAVVASYEKTKKLS